MARVECGCAGHFICADRCLYRRHTQVNGFRVSTVGDLWIDGKRETIGATGYFETMVFKTSDKPDHNNDGCGCRKVLDYISIDCARYDTAGEAQAGHEKLVRKYMRKGAKDE